MFEALGDKAAIEAELNQLDASHEGNLILENLARLGCDRSFVLQTAFLYAYLQYAQECNREQEKETRREHRGLALVGLSWTVQDLRDHIERCKNLAAEIEAFLNGARIPGGNLRDSAEVLVYHLQLPDVLRRYANFAIEIGKQTQVNREINDQKLRVLISLVWHLEERTGRPQFPSIVSLLEAIRQKSCPFTSEISEDLLRKQYRRTKPNPPIEPFSPRSKDR